MALSVGANTFGCTNVSQINPLRGGLVMNNQPKDIFQNSSRADFYSSNDYDYSIDNIGASVRIYKNNDGTYTVKTLGSALNAQVQTKTITEEEFQEKYAKTAVKRYDAQYLGNQEQQVSTCKVSNSLFSGNKITGSINGTKYDIEERRSLSDKKTYQGNINGQETVYTAQTPRGILREGKIKGQIGNNDVELNVTKGLFGKTNIQGTYKGQNIQISIENGAFGKKSILSEDKEFVYSNKVLSNEKSVGGEFAYDDELLPLVMSYIELENAETENDAMAAYMMM